MAKYDVTAPDGSEYEVEAPEGASEAEIIKYAQTQWKAAPHVGSGEKVNRAVAQVPRQLGLAARYVIEGLGQVADIPGAPLASAMKAMGIGGAKPPSVALSGILDRVGVPSPATPTERVVGDAARMLAGGGGMVKGAQLAGKVIPALLPLAARPGLQAASALGSGGAGGYVRETGGDPTSQMLAAIAGGVAAPIALSGLQAVGRGASNIAQSFRAPQNIDFKITQAIESAGYKPTDIPKSVVQQLERDAAAAMQHGDLSTDAMRRLVDYRLLGATPARGNLTLNPVDITRQQNLSKIGANSSSPKLQGLAMRQNENTGTLLHFITFKIRKMP